MKIYKIIIGGLIVLSMISMAWAQGREYHITVPFGPGAGSDVVVRQIQSVFQRNTGNTLIVENKAGAEGMIGITYWKNNPNSDAIILGSNATMYNLAINKNNIHFSDEDFDHIIFTGSLPGIWVTRPDTGIRDPQDLLTKMPRLVGGYVTSFNYNIRPFKKRGIQVDIVDYKTVNDILIDVSNKTLDLGLVGSSPALFAMVRQGKLHIVGASFREDITLEGIKIPSVSKSLGISQFGGGNGIALKPGLSQARAEYLRKELWAAFIDPETQSKLKMLGFQNDYSNDPARIRQFYRQMKEITKLHD